MEIPVWVSFVGMLQIPRKEPYRHSKAEFDTALSGLINTTQNFILSPNHALSDKYAAIQKTPEHPTTRYFHPELSLHP